MKQCMKKNLSRQAGMTLIELLIVLGVGAGIIAGIFVAAKTATDEQTAQQDAKEVAALVANIKRVYGGAGYNSFTAAGLVAAGGLPSGMKVNGTTIVTSNNSPITYTVAASPGLTFSITYGDTNTTQAQCMAVAKSLISYATALNTGATGAGAAGATPTGGSAVLASTGAAVNHANLITGCSSASTARVAAQFS